MHRHIFLMATCTKRKTIGPVWEIVNNSSLEVTWYRSQCSRGTSQFSRDISCYSHHILQSSCSTAELWRFPRCENSYGRVEYIHSRRETKFKILNAFIQSWDVLELIIHCFYQFYCSNYLQPRLDDFLIRFMLVRRSNCYGKIESLKIFCLFVL